ncbi:MULTISPECIES: hypothetical protein [unclassified Novosphingobium]|uniref:hypothetical protein n=1 Tax=unclassified Novosphingobium TaxID=2644732 RepID=UPI00184B9F72|nr:MULTISPECIES: hypothetical protein [unclassified Novosphingobium]
MIVTTNNANGEAAVIGNFLSHRGGGASKSSRGGAKGKDLLHCGIVLQCDFLVLTTSPGCDRPVPIVFVWQDGQRMVMICRDL